ncbi:DUF998 domain-containing protein [Usitatibacter rugosus]|nr:DUF998 domain-containing protein [Usitatibacter rugosus]
MMDLQPLVALVLAALTAATALAVPVYFGNRKPGYSHLRHTISELGEVGSPVGAQVSYVGFVSIALLLWLFLVVAAQSAPGGSSEVFWMLSLVGVGYFGGAIFRCDSGAPAFGTWRNTLHNVFGALGYLGAAAAFSTLRFSSYWAPLSDVMGYAVPLVLVCLLGLSFPHGFRGLIQRVAETTIFAGVAGMGFWVYRAGA